MNNKIKNLLANFGYGMVALPKAEIRPYQLLTMEEDSLSPLNAEFHLLFEPDVNPLPSQKDVEVADLVGQRAFEFDAEVGIGFLKGLFKTFGLSNSKVDLNAGGNKNNKLVYSFNNVTEDKINHLDLDNFLTGAIPQENQFRTYMEKLKRSELYIITSVLKSNSISVNVEDANGQHIDVDAKIEELAKVNAHVKRNNNNGITITNPTVKPLVFGYQAVQILYDKTKWFEFWKPQEAQFRIKKVTGPILKGVEDFPVQLLDPNISLVGF